MVLVAHRGGVVHSAGVMHGPLVVTHRAVLPVAYSIDTLAGPATDQHEDAGGHRDSKNSERHPAQKPPRLLGKPRLA